MLCDVQQKDKKGLVKVRVPRRLLRERKKRREMDSGDLSTDESFEISKEHMRRAMRPVARGKHEESDETTLSEDEGNLSPISRSQIRNLRDGCPSRVKSQV